MRYKKNLPLPSSLLPAPCSLLPAPCSLLPVPRSAVPRSAVLDNCREVY
ncbi:MAG: hypothetical protein F6J98_15050 [Moorea sp. SIO4G2]|nr:MULTISPECIES: hypothetical protein [unclassified Moorena]NEO12788.1 hypothetical protein [Moorena sp. SIO3E8]NEO61677.1 hypothetical protein [Moorena sp. SIO4G2]NEP99563.1 hypothetical protein [Moorena sp. SIO3F7]